MFHHSQTLGGTKPTARGFLSFFFSTVTDATCQEDCYNRLPIGARRSEPAREPSEKVAEQGVQQWKNMGRRVTEIRLRGRSWKISQRIVNTCLKTMTSNNSGKRRRVLESVRRVRSSVTRVADQLDSNGGIPLTPVTAIGSSAGRGGLPAHAHGAGEDLTPPRQAVLPPLGASRGRGTRALRRDGQGRTGPAQATASQPVVGTGVKGIPPKASNRLRSWERPGWSASRPPRRRFAAAPRTREPSFEDSSRQRGMPYAALGGKRAEDLFVEA